ncbi:salicylate synthase [Kibdelosporangium philippinense]|uniref:Salicylate synthase n=1 Tax=Kibdelosporangium philippinense TaxID=211113 RepID=A0ABS8Z6U0_9PSEU|nr:salicylate synthase [Kibdelosporangium philippinense]MCE7003601.1 salicylate synthase [Kibdelosporangium philippinense]
MTEYDREEIATGSADPLDLVTRLARSGFDDYVVYERAGTWTFAGGALATVTLDARRVRVEAGGEVTERSWSGSPGQALREALAELPVTGWRAYGRVNFGFASLVPGLTLRGAAAPTGEIVRLIVPRVEVTLAEGTAVVRAVDTAEHVRELLTADIELDTGQTSAVDITADSANYRERVAQAIKEIRQGQYQKVILSRAVHIPFQVDIVGTYERGRLGNTPARSFVLRLNGAEAAGFSPEIVVSVDGAGHVVTQPLAGTRAFGRGAELDAAARRELENDPKEVFEHAVSVRAAQEELRRICKPESVHVGDFMGIKERGSVQHLASLVNGDLAEDRSAWDALEAVFPAVTASGIPKRESLDAIARMDGSRGLYSGAVVAIDADGSLDAALVLRAVYQEGDQAWLRAGAGIVVDSTPDREFEETCEKLGSVAPFVVPA